MVKSLAELCTAVCLRHIKDISDVGSLPWSKARPILIKIDSPAQLRQVEINSPQLEGDTSECWKRLISRDFPILAAKNNYVPRNPRSWYKIYAKYKREDTEAKEVARAKLNNAFNKIEQEKGDNASKVVTHDSRKFPRLPRDGTGTRRRGRGGAGPSQAELRFTGGSRTKTNNPKNVLKRAMREAKEISARNRLNLPTNPAQVRPGQIVRAPVGMVEEKIKNARPLTGIRPPAYRSDPNARPREIEDGEARLRKAKEMSPQKGGTYITDDDLEDYDVEDEGEDGFVGLEADDLEAMFEQRESNYKAKPSSLGPSSSAASARGSSFARKMGGSSVAPSTTRVPTGKQESPKPALARGEPTRSTRPPEPASPPPKAAPSASSAPVPGAVLPRKRKPVDIFMKPKPKAPRT